MFDIFGKCVTSDALGIEIIGLTRSFPVIHWYPLRFEVDLIIYRKRTHENRLKSN